MVGVGTQIAFKFHRLVCSILGQTVHSTQKSKASAEVWGLQSRLASALSIFFYSLLTALRVGQPNAEVPHRPGCGVRLTAPAGVFPPIFCLCFLPSKNALGSTQKNC